MGGSVRPAAMAWFLCGLVVASAVSVPLYAGDKPRSIRGFKNQALSTARGFGKRASEPDPDDRQPMDDVSVNSMPVEWFASELQGNAALARLVVRKFLDSNRDGELTADELLRPLLTADAPRPRPHQRQLLLQ